MLPIDTSLSLKTFVDDISDGNAEASSILRRILFTYKWEVAEALHDIGWRGQRIVDEYKKRETLSNMVFYIMSVQGRL